jgi:hypothetical protein
VGGVWIGFDSRKSFPCLSAWEKSRREGKMRNRYLLFTAALKDTFPAVD